MIYDKHTPFLTQRPKKVAAWRLRRRGQGRQHDPGARGISGALEATGRSGSRNQLEFLGVEHGPSCGQTSELDFQK